MQEKSLWRATAPLLLDMPQLAGEHKVDVAVIGAGFTGLSAALHLAQKGISVAVLEANEIGHGGSGRNVGLVNAGLWLKPAEVIARTGEKTGERLIKFLGEAPAEVFNLVQKYDMECEAKTNGTLHCAPNVKGVKDLEDRLQQWQDQGAPVTLLDQSQTTDALGTDRYKAALLDKRAGTVQPLSYACGLARAAMSHGVKIYEKSAVLKAEQTTNGWSLQTEKGKVAAEKVICATNAYHEHAQANQPPAMSSLYYFQVATDPLSPNQLARILKGKQGCWDTNTILTSFRLNDEGRFVIGSIGNLDHMGGAFHINWARRTMAQLYPELKDKPFTHQWYGRIALTNDHIPRFANPMPGWAMVWGYNGRGIAPGTVFGKALAEFVQSNDADDVPLAQAKLKAEAFTKTQSFFIELGARGHHFINAR
ncbi:MAG: FAD-binding oxidoreductase [Methylocystaceae bacterium]|nr:FAD-binding oxidoreductase [Methylocystaceae bacterium]